MSDKYKIHDHEKAYFVTMTIVEWIDLFTRKEQRQLMIDSIRYCQQNKGLEIYAWCLMPSHLHIICKSAGENSLSDILRDLKKFTAKAIIKQINDYPESRKEWILSAFSKACEHLKRNQTYKVWQDGNHAEEISTNEFLWQKLAYVHNNPVEELIVAKPEDYYFSSARNYAGLEGSLDVVLVSRKLNT